MAAFSVLFAFSHFLCRLSSFLERCLRLRSSRCRSVPAIEYSFVSIEVVSAIGKCFRMRTENSNEIS